MAVSASIVYLLAFALLHHAVGIHRTVKSQESAIGDVQTRAAKLMLGKMMKRGGFQVSRKIDNEIQSMYSEMDANGDGSVSTQEYSVYFQKTIGGTSSDAQKSFNAIDTDGNKKITFSELRSFILKLAKQHQREQQKQIASTFKKIDVNGDGFITVGEWSQYYKEQGWSLPQDEIQGMIQDIDNDGDGKVNFQEYSKMQNGDVLT
ncbi:calmodulin-like protein 5 [Exaiptasia diaphana]|uniref:EF-hand domain-containing protein n=1 Tax=Exaiptasia diaphana TaxID=2652724 RepID=A0A913XRQ6_EXADI|nr:calmodulin-like protein 5 [Exaiptasia diaphana]